MGWSRASEGWGRVKGLEVRKKRSRFRMYKKVGKYEVNLMLKMFEGEHL